MHQNSFHEVDTYVYAETVSHAGVDLELSSGAKVIEKANWIWIWRTFALPVRERIARAKYVEEENLGELDDIEKEIKEQ